MTSVAARFDTTPGELTSLNKLNSSFIYPGQSLLVPDKTASSGENISDAGSDVTAQGSPTEKTRKLSTEEVQQEEKERGKFFFRDQKPSTLLEVLLLTIIKYVLSLNHKKFFFLNRQVNLNCFQTSCNSKPYNFHFNDEY